MRFEPFFKTIYVENMILMAVKLAHFRGIIVIFHTDGAELDCLGFIGSVSKSFLSGLEIIHDLLHIW